MTPDGEAPKNEFANFLDDIAEEISQRVESLTPAEPRLAHQSMPPSEERHILDWPSVTDRMIDELR